jgi:hypothetical protein
MLPISEQYLNSPCEVCSMENSLILLGYISSFLEDGIQIESKEDKMPIIHCNTPVKIRVMNSKLGFRILVGRVYLSTDSLLRVVEVQDCMDYEKRKFFRVRVDTVAEAIPVPPVTENEENTEPIRPIRVEIRDISLSGLFFISGLEMSIGDQLIVNLSIYDTVISLVCKVVRIIPMELRTKKGYGCEFLDTSGKQFDLLCKYLFDCQRQQIQMMKRYAEELRNTGNTARNQGGSGGR